MLDDVAELVDQVMVGTSMAHCISRCEVLGIRHRRTFAPSSPIKGRSTFGVCPIIELESDSSRE